MENAYFMMFNSLTDILVQLRMLEACIVIIQQKAEEMFIAEGEG